jgi:hypothetical protein
MSRLGLSRLLTVTARRASLIDERQPRRLDRRRRRRGPGLDLSSWFSVVTNPPGCVDSVRRSLRRALGARLPIAGRDPWLTPAARPALARKGWGIKGRDGST